jgi:RNA polymerase sigma-70 factor (ECF subfamily)
MVLRKRRRVAETPIEQMCDDSGTLRTWEPPGHSETPEACYARRESEEMLRNAIQRLPCILRDALELQHSREYSASQIAEELGISVPAAKSRLLRARKAIRHCLSATRPPKPLSTRSASPSEGNSKTSGASSKTV